MNDAIELSFDIKLNHYCNLTKCNILSIGNLNNYGFISLAINGADNLIEFNIASAYIVLPAADTLLPVDNQYHSIYFSFAFVLNISDPTQYINYFSIDNVSYYFSSTVPSQTSQIQQYSLYFSAPYEDAVDAVVSNICISSDRIISGEIQCGEVVSGKLRPGIDEDYFYFNSTLNNRTLSVLFDSCNSSYDTYLYLYDMDFNALYEGGDDGTCYTKEQLRIGSLYPGQYILGISASGDWNIRVNCSFNSIITNDEINSSSSYILRSRDYWPDWFPGEICEYTYGTTLATINTADDKREAFDLIQGSLHEYQMTAASSDFWIGMYRDTTTDNKWQWLDGTLCDQTPTGDCADIANWQHGRPMSVNQSVDNVTYSRVYSSYSTIPIFGSVLVLPSVINNTATIVDEPFSFFQEFDQRFWRWYLCNAPNSKYVPQNCTEELNCWKKHDCCDDMILNADTSTDRTFFGTPYQPSIAHWNGQLFVFGVHQIHSANIKQLTGHYNWNHTEYHRQNVSAYEPCRYYQYQSSLYRLYETRNVGNQTWLDVEAHEYDYILEHIDLNTLTVTYHKTSQIIGTFIHCMVAGGENVYLIRERDILVYTINKNKWNIFTYDDITLQSLTVFFDFQPVACTMTSNHSYIHIFSQSYIIPLVTPYDYVYSDKLDFFVVKYDTESTTFTILNIPNLCVVKSQWYDDSVSVITGRDNKIYLQGCYTAAWKTLIFDPETENFENKTVNIDHPIPTNTTMPYYRQSQLAVVDDNILLLLYKDSTDNSISLYTAITDLISINFTETTSANVWPSDGFLIKYYVNDFTNYPHPSDVVYYLTFYSEATMNDIAAAVVLNTSNDHCVCNETIYNCKNCQQHFDLKHYLTLSDNDRTELEFVAVHSNTDSLIIPKYITIELERCSISFMDLGITTTDYSPAIEFTFWLSSNCYSRVGTKFSLNITAPSLNLFTELIISIVTNSTKTSKLCDVNIDCFEFNNGSSFVIYHETNGVKDGSFDVIIESNMIDFRINTSRINVLQYITSKKRNIFDKRLLNLLYLLIIPIIILLIVFMYLRKQYKNAFVIKNSLVAIIGISQFDDKTLHLGGVEKNVRDLTKLWRDEYNYDVFVCNESTLYVTKRDVIMFIDSYKHKLRDEHYKSVIVHIISHGGDDSFSSSDGQNIPIELIRHELIEESRFLEQKELIKVIFHHGCRGHADYNISSNPSRTTDANENGGYNYEMRATFNAAFNANGLIDNTEHINITYESNCVTIAGTITGRAMSDSGTFTDCICDSFGDNLNRIIKASFNTLITEIGRTLENKTNHAELCNINGTLRYDSIRFEKSTANKYHLDVEMQQIESINNINHDPQQENSNDPKLQRMVFEEEKNATEIGIDETEIVNDKIM